MQYSIHKMWWIMNGLILFRYHRRRKNSNQILFSLRLCVIKCSTRQLLILCHAISQNFNILIKRQQSARKKNMCKIPHEMCKSVIKLESQIFSL